MDISYDSASLESVSDFDAVLIGDIRLTRTVENIDGPKLIQLTRGDHADLDILALKRSGVTIAGASPVLARHVSEHALGLACAVLGDSDLQGATSRDDVEKALSANADWLRNLKLGIVGLGRVGQRMAEQAKGLFKEIVFADVRTPPHGVVSNLGIRRSTLDLVLSTCDVVSLHVQWGPASNLLLDERELRLMSRDSVLVNTADVRLVSESALTEIVEAGGIRGCGLDVIGEAASGTENTLLAVRGVVATPYVAGRGDHADDEVAAFIVANIEKALETGSPEGLIEVIDFPRAGDPSFWSSEMAPRA